MAMTKVNIQIPFFPGLYESELYNCDTLYYEFNDEDAMEYYRERFEDESLTAEDLDIDFPKFKEDVGKEYVDAFRYCNECPKFIESAEFTDIDSPRYYNFETDKVYADIELADGWRKDVRDFMTENKEWLSKRIAEDWTSRDGFWSYMDNTFDEWYNRFNDEQEEVDERYISCIIAYMMYNENNEIRYDLSTAVLDELIISNYIINVKKSDVA